MMDNVEAQAELIIQEIVTAAEKEQAEQDVKHTSAAMWRAVRLSLRLQEETAGELTKSACRVAVAQLYECSDSTIRRREKAGRMVTDEMLAEYPLLSFSYWRTACDASHLETPLESLLDIVYQIYEYREAYGKLPAVSTVEGWVYGDNGKLVWRSRLESVETLLEKVINDQQTDPQARGFLGIIRNYLLVYLETGRSPFEPAPSLEESYKNDPGWHQAPFK